jgi:hypothetical protein
LGFGIHTRVVRISVLRDIDESKKHEDPFYFSRTATNHLGVPISSCFNTPTIGPLSIEHHEGIIAFQKEVLQEAGRARGRFKATPFATSTDGKCNTLEAAIVHSVIVRWRGFSG